LESGPDRLVPVLWQGGEGRPAGTLRRGQGLAGRVWASGSPQMVDRLEMDEGLERHREAARQGLTSATAFPIFGAHRIIGVLEFFGDRPFRQDATLPPMMQAIGAEIAQFVQRHHAEEALRASETRYRGLFENAAVGIAEL